MIAYSYIERNLNTLDSRYRRTNSNKDANYYSKLAVLELCGWIEISMDDIILITGNRILKDTQSRKFLSEKVKGNYGFEYKKHFKSMMVNLVGISGYEKVSRQIPPHIKLGFSSELGNLKKSRDSLAHTYTKGATHHYDAPSVTINRMQIVRNGLQSYDKAIRKTYP